MNQSSPQRVLKTAALGLSILVACMLTFSAITHVGNPFAFASVIKSYRLLGSGVGLATAFTLPFLEMSVAASLLFQARYRRLAFLLAGVLFLIYVTAQVTALTRGLDIACGCFGTDSARIGARSIAIAVTGLTASAAGMILTKAERGKLAYERAGESEHMVRH